MSGSMDHMFDKLHMDYGGVADARQVVLLASFPRSGNTLFRQVLEQCYGVPTYTLYKTEGEILWPDRVWPDNAPDGQPVYFVKDHAFTRHEGPIIYIVRDGRDTLLSLWHYTQHVQDLAVQMADGTWTAHVEWFLGQSPVVVRYEDMLANPLGVVSAAVCKAGLEWAYVGDGGEPGELTPFEELHEVCPDFFRSGKVGQWRDALTPEVHEAFWSVNGPAMEALGYER